MDVQTVWQCNIHNVRLSTNGGQIWEAASESDVGSCTTLSFVDTQSGWVLVHDLKATADGGQTWEEVTLPEDVHEVIAISLRTPSEGYVLTPDGILVQTPDGGKSWSHLALDIKDHGEMHIAPHNLPTATVRFFDADHGLVVLSLVGDGESKVVALRTADGGQTWEEETVPAKIGKPYISRDGKFLTIASLLTAGEVVVLEYQGD